MSTPIKELTGCAISFLIFVVFFALGLFAISGGVYLFVEGIKHFGESFWRVMETVGGFILAIVSPIGLIRISLKYKKIKDQGKVDKQP